MSVIKVLTLPNVCENQEVGEAGSSRPLQLLAAMPADRPTILNPGDRSVIPTGLALELSDGWEAQVMPLAAFALETGVTVLNSPGTIDPDYRGEIVVLLINLGQQQVTISRGLPIAILKFAPFVRVTVVPTDILSESGRSTNGLGSTGK